MHAIPTRYAGVEFRSRLEARWAAFFDLMGWKWEYEPLDLRGYIPDFVLYLNRPLLIEVKPYVEYEEYEEATAKIDASGWEEEALIVGSRILDGGRGGYGFEEWPTLGLLRECCPAVLTGERDHCWWEEAKIFHCRKCGAPSFMHAGGSWCSRTCGCYDGDHYLGQPGDEMVVNFREAGNLVQWKGRGGRPYVPYPRDSRTVTQRLKEVSPVYPGMEEPPLEGPDLMEQRRIVAQAVAMCPDPPAGDTPYLPDECARDPLQYYNRVLAKRRKDVVET